MNITDLVKAALVPAKGRPLYKGEAEGHPFRGNQHTSGEAGGESDNTLPQVDAKSVEKGTNLMFSEVVDAYGKEEEVDPKDVLSGQAKLSNDRMAEYRANKDTVAKPGAGKTEGGKLPVVMKYGGKMVVIDGNHRMAAALERGDKIKAIVVDADKAYAEAKAVFDSAVERGVFSARSRFTPQQQASFAVDNARKILREGANKMDQKKDDVMGLMKAALAPDKGVNMNPLFKGEDTGHPFRGNQHTGGEGGGDSKDGGGKEADYEKRNGLNPEDVITGKQQNAHIAAKVADKFKGKGDVKVIQSGEDTKVRIGKEKYIMTSGFKGTTYDFAPMAGSPGEAFSVPKPTWKDVGKAEDPDALLKAALNPAKGVRELGYVK